MEQHVLGFTPGALGEATRRLQILDSGADWIALEKPHGVGTHPHPLFPGSPSLTASLYRQKIRIPGWSDSRKHTVPRLYSSFYLEPDLYGWALLSRSPDWLQSMRNDLGSALVCFTFAFLARDETPEAGSERKCQLPIGESLEAVPPVGISHRRGKKSETLFHRLRHWPLLGLELWTGVTSFPRPLQIRLHAFESGLRIPGDLFWGKEEAIWRETFYRKRTRERTPFFFGLPIWLQSVDFQKTRLAKKGLLPQKLAAPVPDKWVEFQKKADAL